MNTLVLIGLALLFFALIMASIALHEIGHLVPAKIFGIKMTQYFVGFGRTIWPGNGVRPSTDSSCSRLAATSG